MIPVLFPPGTKDFTTNGLGRLAECTRFEVTEERNGIYECEFEYPQTGKLFDQIIEGALVYATHDDSKEPQPFEVYSRTAPIEGVATFRAWHISYALNNTILKPFTANSITAAFAAIPSNCITNCEFEFWTDKSVAANFTVDVPKSVRAALGGSQGSILDVYGKGDYEFDMFTVKLWANRGTDRGVSIRYGKNLVSLDQQLDASNQYNGYIPYWSGGQDGEVVYLDHAVYGSTQINTEGTLEVRSLEPIQTHTPADILVRYGTTRVIPLDLSSYFQSKPTKAELQARAQTLISNSDAYEVKENISIDFVQLWQTEEYKNVANLQRVFLCDTVHIYYSKLGINATAKCIKVVYDTLRDRYISMELGAPTTSLGDQVAEIVNSATKDLPTRSSMIDAIQSATELITGGFGGYIKYTYLSDGTPSEMLIMDSPDEATATNIIRLNQNGLGFSTDGGATYGNAWTIDGRLNADYIMTGTLNADLIKAGTIQDVTGKNSWDLAAGDLITKSLSASDYVYINGGVGSYFNIPLSSTNPANRYFRIEAPANYGDPFVTIKTDSESSTDPDESADLTILPGEIKWTDTGSNMSFTPHGLQFTGAYSSGTPRITLTQSDRFRIETVGGDNTIIREDRITTTGYLSVGLFASITGNLDVNGTITSGGNEVLMIH